MFDHRKSVTRDLISVTKNLTLNIEIREWVDPDFSPKTRALISVNPCTGFLEKNNETGWENTYSQHKKNDKKVFSEYTRPVSKVHQEFLCVFF